MSKCSYHGATSRSLFPFKVNDRFNMDINKGDHIEYRFKRFSIVLRTYVHDGRYQNLNIDSVTLFFNKLIAILTQESFI